MTKLNLVTTLLQVEFNKKWYKYRRSETKCHSKAKKMELGENLSSTSESEILDESLNLKKEVELLHFKIDEIKSILVEMLENTKRKTKNQVWPTDVLRACPNNFKVVEMVLLKWRSSNKSDTIFDPNPFRIIEVNGSMITFERNGKILIRNEYFIRRYIPIVLNDLSIEDFVFGKATIIYQPPII
ncbi:hypothetical protein BpHYR1_007835 [Brachionus plicatilis]|uniref:Uncharacterized protein n=1 Tax=Brachionus plicatilis TaxID=10195 RepID=A0A3M7S5K5_BRAPC|nr:hypothetical protein BpHYR1_007835 [Brachionus plicatilis]